MKPAIAILHAPGTNRDEEVGRACTIAGGVPKIIHINQLRAGASHLSDFQALVLPGGFSYGDALGAGTRLALDMHVFIQTELHQFIESGRQVLGICNGFQALVKSGHLPGNHSSQTQALAGEDARKVTLTDNANGRFECRWVHLAPNLDAPSPVVRQLRQLIFCPVAHGEGNFQTDNALTLHRLEVDNLVAFRYVDASGSRAAGKYPLNPNGSVGDIAGICNRRGNVLGLMPHPEDHLTSVQNPLQTGNSFGLALFEALIAVL